MPRAPRPAADVPSLWGVGPFRGATCVVLMTSANYQECPLPAVDENGAIRFAHTPAVMRLQLSSGFHRPHPS